VRDLFFSVHRKEQISPAFRGRGEEPEIFAGVAGFAGIVAVVRDAVILWSFCYAGFLRRMRWGGRIF
jgi:hypothetical protein